MNEVRDKPPWTHITGYCLSSLQSLIGGVDKNMHDFFLIGSSCYWDSDLRYGGLDINIKI